MLAGFLTNMCELMTKEEIVRTAHGVGCCL